MHGVYAVMNDLPPPDQVKAEAKATTAVERKDPAGIITPARIPGQVLPPAGDTFLVYPGGNSSIRFEKLREGIVDYEKVRILRALASRSANGEVKRQLRALDDHLRTFVGDPDYGKRDYGVARLTEAVHKGMRMLEALSERLAQ